MKSFINFVVESKEFITEAKNLHLEHVEDEILNNGVDGGRDAINFIQSLRDMLAGTAKSSVNLSTKWDGAPAIFAGTDPSDGKFFVAKKSVFNKDPILYKKQSEIDLTGDLGDKFKIALKEFSKLGIKDVLQGDLLYTSLSSDIDDHWTFQPNTIMYAVPKDSDIGKKIAKSKIGIVWHTTYTGDTLEGMSASFGVNQNLKEIKTVWQTDAKYKDVSGTAKMTVAETNAVTKDLKNAGTIFGKINSSKLKRWNSLQSTLPPPAQWKTYQNFLIKNNSKIRGGRMQVAEYFKFVHEAFLKITATKKTEKTKKQWMERKEQFFKELRTHTGHMVTVVDFMGQIVNAKMKILKKLNSINQLGIGTFVKTSDGFKVTAPEGYVIADKTQKAVKLVDRLEFSRLNFTAAKSWVKG
jgi:hypothetical protein